MEDLVRVDTKVREDIEKAYVSEYADLSDSWKVIETKAQGTAAIAGVFLAATSSFASDITNKTAWLDRIFLILVNFFLVLAIGAAIRALWVRQPARAPGGNVLAHLGAPVIRNPQQGEGAVYRQYLNDKEDHWMSTISDLFKNNEVKAKHLTWAQRFLVSAAAGFVAYSLNALITR